MLIRKQYAFEAAHIVRNCFTQRCSRSLHGHSYRAELIISTSCLDQADMVMDFGLLKQTVYDLFDSFDHATILKFDDDSDLIASIKRHSERHILLPGNPTAENMAAFFAQSSKLLLESYMPQYKEGVLRVEKVIVHETVTGYAEATLNDAFSPQAYFSPAIRADWKDSRLLDLGIHNEHI